MYFSSKNYNAKLKLPQVWQMNLTFVLQHSCKPLFLQTENETDEYEDQLGRFRNYCFTCLRNPLCIAAIIPFLITIVWGEHY